MKLYVKILISVSIIIGLAFLYGFTSKRSSNKTTQKLVVVFDEGDNSFLTHKEVENLLVKNNLVSQKQLIKDVNLHDTEQLIMSNPYVKEASVFLDFDRNINVQLRQKKPIVRLLTSKGSFYLDSEANRMPLSYNFTEHVPLALGFRKEEQEQELVEFVNYINKDEFLKKEIVGIERKVTGDYLFNVRSGKYKVNFGKFNNSQVKFQKLKAFYNKAFFDKTIHNYKIINLKYHNQVVCSK